MTIRTAARAATRGVLLLAMLVGVFGATYAFGAASAATRPEPQTTVADVEDEVMCPTCNSTLNASSSPAAERMRLLVRRLVAEGLTKDEIKDRLVAEYGGNEAILATPRPRGIGVLAWLVPVLVALVAAVSGVVLVTRWRRRRTALDDVAAGQASSSTSSPASSS